MSNPDKNQGYTEPMGRTCLRNEKPEDLGTSGPSEELRLSGPDKNCNNDLPYRNIFNI